MIRIGHNPNTNMLPMFYFLPRHTPLLEWVTAEPAGHNAMLAEGRIDMAPISNFSYAQHWRDYAVLPDFSVSTKGRVGSILLFSKVPLEELKGTVALTANSASSVNLTKILLHRYYHVFPSYMTMSAGLAEMFKVADAALLIADMAITAAAAKPDCYIYDLGEEWLRKTGCSMTYALWAMPKRLMEEKSEEIKEVHRLLTEAKNQALQNWEEIYEACTKMIGGTGDFWADYFSQFHYDLDDGLIKGIEKYYELCFAEKLLPELPRLNFWG